MSEENIPNFEEPVISDETIDIPNINTNPIVQTAPAQEENNINTETPEPVVEKKEEDVKLEYEKPIKSYQVKYNFSTNYTSWSDDAITLEMPSDYSKNIKKIIENMPNIEMGGEQEELWTTTIESSIQNLPNNDQYFNSINKEDADYQQAVEYKGGEIGIKEIKTNFKGNKLTGEKAILAFNKSQGLGNIFQVPLFHSGFYVTLKTPSEIEIINLHREILESKINLGRATQGLAFSNVMVYTIQSLAKFALDHILETSLQTSVLENKDIMELIMVHDYPILVWGLLCTMYPKGVQYTRACLSDPDKCSYVLKETLNLTKLHWTDSRALTETHKTHILNRTPRQFTLDSILNYQKSLPAITNKTIKKDNVTFTLKVPNMLSYVQSGDRWINGIVNKIDQISKEDNEKAKQALIQQYAQATRLRQVSHWFASIEFDDNIVDDQDTIEQLLDVMSQDETLSKFIIDEVFNYIDESTISLIGIPSYNCPSCGEEQKTETGRFEHVIPLDVTTIFFDQHVQRMSQIVVR